MLEPVAALIVTLKLDAASFICLDALRQAHFPPERNYLRAHVTLFHALPGKENDAIQSLLAKFSAPIAPFKLELPTLRFLGRGVAIDVRSEALLSLRAELARQFHGWLNAQDRQAYRPHVTIQNKVNPEVARNLLQAMTAEWRASRATAEGLLLWEYLGGPWRKVAEFPFAGRGDHEDAVMSP